MARRIPDTPSPNSSVPPGTSAVPLLDGWQAVVISWRDEALLAEQTTARLEQLGTRFVTRLQAEGITDWADVTTEQCRGFVTAHTHRGGPPSASTQHLRRATVRAIFRALRAQPGIVLPVDPSIDLALPPRSRRGYRPLTEDEVILCRASSRLARSGTSSLRRAVAWALGEATGTTSEIAAVTLADLDEPSAPTTVMFRGRSRHAARTGTLSDWGRLVVARHTRLLLEVHAPAGTLLAYAGAGTPGEYQAQASVCTGITRILQLAGLLDDPAVRARSLRGWAGARLYQQGLPIEQVARRLGCASLDAAAAEIGLTWNHPA